MSEKRAPTLARNTKRAAAPSEELSKSFRVIATNVPFNIEEKDILNFFSGAHSIERHTKNGVLTGAVFVQCKNITDVNRFIKTHNGKELEGRVIGVSYLEDREVFKAKKKQANDDENERGRKRRQEYEGESKKRTMPDGEEERTIFITNLSFKEGDAELTEKFSQYGEVEQCTIVSNKETGISTGRAFILFKDPASCKLALKDQVILNNRVLVVLKYVSPDTLRKRESDADSKTKQREKTIKDRKEGKIEQRDPDQKSTCRLHLSHMDKKLNRRTASKAIEEYFLKNLDKKVKLRGVNITSDKTKKNPGYGFVTFKFPEDAQTFLEHQKLLTKGLGWRMTAEYAMESKEFLEKGIKKKPSKADRLAKKAAK
ncbi:hypothetical protein NEDG_00294 [Nematocida displodere]|uniref:RRM domain-containing protein n=1 Tax=Nematocida displodere TaxID=1805483 RepID=A0A177ELG5_9MICR|nr:hypothetical protein NEDG_00294 [Nematocida displodere]